MKKTVTNDAAKNETANNTAASSPPKNNAAKKPSMTLKCGVRAGCDPCIKPL